MNNLNKGILKTEIGNLEIIASTSGINEIKFMSEDAVMQVYPMNNLIEKYKLQLHEYFKGKRKVFDVELDLTGTDFQKKVWNELLNIPFGETISYLELARRLGDKNSIRAAGLANGKNPVPIIIPCHRVIGGDGSLVGYSGGLWRKKWLLEHEAMFSKKEKQLEIF